LVPSSVNPFEGDAAWAEPDLLTFLQAVKNLAQRLRLNGDQKNCTGQGPQKISI
jgi:hypothetical protein